MKARIVLSALALVLLIACGNDARLDDDPLMADGIGTSPSEDIIQLVPAPAPAPARTARGIGTSPSSTVTPCGIWVAATQEQADIESNYRDPDIIQYALPGGLSCSDALRIARDWPAGRGAWVRYWTP